MAREETLRTKGGVIITDELAERLANEAEAGYDIDRVDPARIHRRGRKSLAGGAGKSPRINLRIEQAVFDRLAAAAAETGESISDLVRDAIERQIRRLERAARR